MPHTRTRVIKGREPTKLAGVDNAGRKGEYAYAVSYFTGSQPIEGSDTYLATYKNAIFKFASLENRNTFRENPERYVPQYGGYCAFGTKGEKKFDIDPLVWRIEDGKLYLNKDKNAQRIWVKDVPGNIDEADVAGVGQCR